MKPFFSTRALFAALVFLNLVFCAALFAAGATRLSTYVNAPYGYYKELTAKTALNVGNSTTAATSITLNGSNTSNQVPLAVKNNGTQTYQSGTSGGGMSVSGDFSVADSSSRSLFFVKSSNNRVGIGTTSPRTTLDVQRNLTRQGTNGVNLNDVKSMVIASHQVGAVQNYTYPWAEMNAQYNAADNNTDTPLNPGARAGFAGISSDNVTNADPSTNAYYPKYWVTTHIDGNPVLIQSINKSPDVVTGGGYGQVVIRGFPTLASQFTGAGVYNGLLPAGAPPLPSTSATYTLNNAALIVGEWTNSQYTVANSASYTPQTRANSYVGLSSRAFKKDIVPLAPADYRQSLDRLVRTDIFYYRYKSDPEGTRPRVGYMADDAPKEVIRDGVGVSFQENNGFLLSALKALQMENKEMSDRIERLKK